MKNTKGKYQGFTLIEVLMVIVLLIFLFAIVIVAINPAEHLRNARNTQRSSDVTQVLNAVLQYTADMDEENRTRYPGDSGSEADLGISECGSTEGAEDIADVANDADVDLEDALVDDYLAGFPEDPHVGELEPGKTGYLICYNEFDDTTDTKDGRIVVSSELAEDPYERSVVGSDLTEDNLDDYIMVLR